MPPLKPRLGFRVPLQSRRHRLRNFTADSRHSADHVRIVEVGPRDGLQNEKNTIPLETKIELIERLAKTGVRNLEAGSFVPAKWVPQVSVIIQRSYVWEECILVAAITFGTPRTNGFSAMTADGEHLRGPEEYPEATSRSAPAHCL